MKQIRYFKLTSGEEFMGEIVSEDENFITISQPAIIVPHPQDTNKATLQPWGPLNYTKEKEISLKKTALAADPEVLKPELEKLYLSATSKIEIVTPGMLSEIHKR